MRSRPFGGWAVRAGCAVVAGVAGPGVCQEWVRQSPLPADGHLYDAHFTDIVNGWVVGHDGIFLRTSDGGETWAQHVSFQRSSFGDPPVRHVQFVDALHGFAGGDNVYRTTDGGETWEDMGYHGTVGRMVFLSAQVGFISGNSGLRRTVDGGETFETIGPRADVAFADGSTGVYVFSGGVFRTGDAGESWEAISPTPLSLVAYLSPDVLIAVHNDNVLPGDHTFYRSADGGETWDEVFSDNSYSGSRYIVDVERIDADSVGAVDVNGAVWVSDDAGITWSKTQEQIGEFFSATIESWGLHFPTPSIGYAAGGPGVILKTIDGGHTWSMLSSGGVFELRDIEMHESGLGIAVGEDLGVLRTTDFGRSWTPSRADTLPYSELRSVQIIDGDTVVACGQNEAFDPTEALAIFYRSDDGGRTWELRNSGIALGRPWSFETVHFIDGQRGWLFGSTLIDPEPAVYHTTDGGMSWTLLTESVGFPSEGQMIDGQRGWLTSGGALWLTANNWQSWSQVDLPVGRGNVNDFEFVDAGTGWMLGRFGEVLRTDDGGMTFEHQTLPGFDPMYDLGFDLRALSHSEAVAATWHAQGGNMWGALYRTTDGGETWTALGRIIDPDNSFGGRILAVESFEGGAIWAASSEDGFIWAADIPVACPADFNGDGVVDTRDVLAFLNVWSAQGEGADFDGDGAIDTRDVLAFLNAWNAGC